jgi:hypothetical protein
MCLHYGAVSIHGTRLTCDCTCPVCPKDAQVPTFLRHSPTWANKRADNDLDVFSFRFEKVAFGGGPLLVVEGVAKRDDKWWFKAPPRKLAVDFR